jgi:nucleotide-binding universal stress UspA family protein
MPLYKAIICGIDFSEHSKRALDLSAEFANRSGARITALHVIDFLLAEAAAVAYDVERLTSDAEAELRALVRDVTGPSSGVQVVVRTGRTEQAILAYAAECGADLIAMGTHGLGGVRKLVFGSVTEKILRSVKVPALTVPYRAAHPAGRPAIDAVVAGLDLEPESEHVAAHAVGLAQQFGVPLTLVHAIPPGPLAPYAVEAFGHAMPALRSRAEQQMEAIALKFAKQVSVTTEVRFGPAPEELAAQASSLPNALVVIGLGGRGLLHRPGSTAYRVLCLAETPVIAVPASSRS